MNIYLLCLRVNEELLIFYRKKRKSGLFKAGSRMHKTELSNSTREVPLLQRLGMLPLALKSKVIELTQRKGSWCMAVTFPKVPSSVVRREVTQSILRGLSTKVAFVSVDITDPSPIFSNKYVISEVGKASPRYEKGAVIGYGHKEIHVSLCTD